MFGVVEHDDVDIAGIVELERAQLSHGDDEVAGRGIRTVWHRTNLTSRARLPKQEPDRLLKRGVRGHAHGGNDRFDRPDATEIGKAHKQRHALLEAPQQAGDILRPLSLRDRRGKLRSRLLEMSVRVLEEAIGKGLRIALGDGRQIGRAGERPQQQLAHLRRFSDQLAGRSKCLVGGKTLCKRRQHVFPARRVKDPGAFGDAFEERRHARPISAPGGTCEAAPATSALPSRGNERTTRRPG